MASAVVNGRLKKKNFKSPKVTAEQPNLAASESGLTCRHGLFKKNLRLAPIGDSGNG